MFPLRLTLVPLLLAALAGPAWAERVLLTSGKHLDATKVEVVDKGVKVTLAVSGGTARVTYPFHRIDPTYLVPLLDAHLLKGVDPEADARAALQIAKIAFDAGLLSEAGSHFAQAAVLDPTLAKERDEGLAKIRQIEADAALTLIEGLLRDGDAFAVLAEADALASSALGQVITPVEAMRVKTLTSMAQKLLDKAAALEAQAAQDAAEAKGAVDAPSLDDVDKKTGALLEEVYAGVEKAIVAREAAIDPDITNREARRHLEVAGRALLDARRTINTIDVAPIPDVVAEAADLVREMLVTTYLDVADLYREDEDFDAARRWLRAASVLDPEGQRVAEVRDRIEQDLALPYEEPPPWYGPVEAYTIYPGGILPFGYGRGCGCGGYGFGGFRRGYGYGFGGYARGYYRHGGFRIR